LATLHILKHPEKYGINNITIDKPLEYETVSMANRVHLRDVAKIIGTSEKAMRELNPELRHKILPTKRYSLKVPVGKKNILITKLDEIPVTLKPKEVFITHRVKRGETLSTIAEKYRVSINTIVRTNNINRYNYIIAGQTLKIPKKSTVSFKTPKYRRSKKTFALRHVVKRGDSLWIIAKRYGTTTQQIMENNHLHNTRLQIGQVLRIFQAEYKATVDEGSKIYHVRRGDNPFYIAKRHSMELERFLRINRLTPKSKIFPGQQLFVE
jgi:membrane-bound lytic murein transglycosylase D